MFRQSLFNIAITLVALVFGASAARAHEVEISFAEMAQTADLIFVGTVESQSSRINDTGSMIFTDVMFADVETVNTTTRSKQQGSSRVQLTFPGGTVGNLTISLCSEVRLETGRRYVLFALDDGRVYTSPLVGGSQGLFEVARGRQTGEEFVLTAGRRAVVDVEGASLVASDAPVAAIDGGRLVADPSEQSLRKTGVEPPVSSDGTRAMPTTLNKGGGQERPLGFRSFVDRIKNVALKATLTERVLRRDELGQSLETGGGRLVAEAVTRRAPRPVSGVAASGPAFSRTPPVPRATGEAARGAVSSAASENGKAGGTLGACGFQELNIVMEQYPSDWPEFNIANECMSVWNHARDVFRWRPADGTYGKNDVNEFGGFPSNADLMNVYGVSWAPDDVGLTVVNWSDGKCTEIDEADVFLNPAVNWTDNVQESVKPSGPSNIRATLMHELGHVWGAQAGGPFVETYDYDRPTVMHEVTESVEDGWGVHAVDAWLIRRVYDWQDVVGDLGVESYFASNGLNDSTINGTKFKPGDTITVSGVTVENMSNFPLSNANVVFYLSTDQIITTDDIEMESFWFFDSFPAESHGVFDFTPTIPGNVPPGTYYVGAIATLSGFEMDSTPWNNATFFKKPITVPLPVASPVVDRVTTLQRPDKPWLMRLNGSGFQPNLQVFIGEDSTPWGAFKLKNPNLLVLKGGKRLQRRFPVGVEVPIRIVNPDGGETFVTFVR
jgi:hypothetical protein